MTFLGTRLGHHHTVCGSVWATTTLRAAVNHSPVGSFSSRSSVHAHSHWSNQSRKYTTQAQPFSPLPFTIPELYFGMQSKAVWAKKRMWAAGLSGGGQDWATQAATSEKLVFLQPGYFCHPDTGPRPAPPDLLPIFGLRDLDSKSAPGSASDAAAVIPRVHLLTRLLHHLTLLWK